MFWPQGGITVQTTQIHQCNLRLTVSVEFKHSQRELTSSTCYENVRLLGFWHDVELWSGVVGSYLLVGWHHNGTMVISKKTRPSDLLRYPTNAYYIVALST
jgi:hypothetical protein